MGGWRSGGKRTYPESLFLAEAITSDELWGSFDGWCASTRVDPLELPWSRFLNLVYYYITRNASKEDKQKIDSDISAMNARWVMEKAAVTSRNALSATHSAEKSSRVPDTTDEVKPTRRSKLPPAPAGWGTPEDHYRTSLVVAQSLKAANGKR